MHPDSKEILGNACQAHVPARTELVLILAGNTACLPPGVRESQCTARLWRATHEEGQFTDVELAICRTQRTQRRACMRRS